jgi:hypothetical protein
MRCWKWWTSVEQCTNWAERGCDLANCE